VILDRGKHRPLGNCNLRSVRCTDIFILAYAMLSAANRSYVKRRYGLKAFLQGQWLGHPLHPLLVHVPSALWPAALLFDLLANFGVGGNVLVQTSFYAIAAGILVSLLAMVTGFADFWDVKPDKPAYHIGIYHMTLNIVALAIWAANASVRVPDWREASTVPPVALALSVVGTAVILVSGYLGGRMIYSHGISVARLSKERWREIAEGGNAKLPS
jgi:uncharacterized membrane protein